MVIGTDENNGNGDYFKGNGNASVCSKKESCIQLLFYTSYFSLYIVHVHVINLV